jgi:hypothetical protein
MDGAGGRVATAEGETFTNWHAASTLQIETPDGAARTEEFAPVDPYRLMIEAIAARVRGEDVWLAGAQESLAVATTLAGIRARM